MTKWEKYAIIKDTMDTQLDIMTIEQESTPLSEKTCVFTGHRQLGEDFSARKLKKQIRLLMQEGVEIFFNGMAMGCDLLAAEYVLQLKKEFPSVKLVACVPCYGQEKYFPQHDQRRYVKILKKADETVVLSDHYFNGCMQKRDLYMAERADVMIAYCNKKEGGAAYTVKCFQKTHPNGRIFFI